MVGTIHRAIGRGRVYDSVMGLALGTILTGVGIMAYRRRRGGKSYPSLPGHWLMILGLAAAVANGAAIAVFNVLVRLYDPPSRWPPVRSTCRRCSSSNSSDRATPT